MSITSVFSEEALKQYYNRIFPYEQMYDWLRYNEADYFARREFSFTKANDVYIRYLSFASAGEMREKMKLHCPEKIDIGAVYTVPAKEHNTVAASKFRPLSRELVFDIDLTDYADVQVGMKPGDKMWDKGCWQYMACAMKIVDAALREDFGFKHIFWVFSGRRGVHCWVCDERARDLEDNERSAVVNYLTLVTSGGGNANNNNNANKSSSNNENDDGTSQNNNNNAFGQVKLTTPLHPSVRRALEKCEDAFERVAVPDDMQGLLATRERWFRVLAMIPDPELRERLDGEWTRVGEGNASSSHRWQQLKATVEDAMEKRRKSRGFEAEKLRRALDFIVLYHTYPRLDVNVSTHRNHLLKAPFAVHPKTGKVCVPLVDVSHAEEFDPDGVPTLETMLAEIDAGKPANGTSLSTYVNAFQNAFLKPLYDELRRKEREAREKTAAVTGDW